MDVYKILTFPDPFLTTVAKPVEKSDDDLERIIETMINTMYNYVGVGLAATQVGIDKRLFVVDVNYNKDDPDSQKNPIVIINPEIVSESDMQSAEEGCLSVPEFRAEVQRFTKITLQYQNINLEDQIIEAEGLFAICIQHELDHLNGKLFIDRLRPLQRKIIKTKLKKKASDNSRN
ncbi:peptide deformylase [bacterium]|nr:peptide deformylase [bacterium]